MSEMKNDMTQNPFTVPDGYFESLEDRVRERIHRPATPFATFVMKAKPAFMMALMFGVIAGFGWIASRITPLLYEDPMDSEDPIMAMIEQGYLESSCIYAYSEEINLDEAFTYSLENTVTIEGEVEEELEATLTADDIIEYLEEEDIDLKLEKSNGCQRL